MLTLICVCLFSACDDLPGYHMQHIFLFFSLFFYCFFPKAPNELLLYDVLLFSSREFSFEFFWVQICPDSVAGSGAKENRNCREGRRAQCAVCLSEPYALEPIRTVQEKRGDKTRV